MTTIEYVLLFYSTFIIFDYAGVSCIWLVQICEVNCEMNKCENISSGAVHPFIIKFLCIAEFKGICLWLLLCVSIPLQYWCPERRQVTKKKVKKFQFVLVVIHSSEYLCLYYMIQCVLWTVNLSNGISAELNLFTFPLTIV